jgi:hypothetical protein
MSSKKVERAVTRVLSSKAEQDELKRLRQENARLTKAAAAPPPAKPAADDPEPADPVAGVRVEIEQIEQAANSGIARGHGRFAETKRNHLIASIAKAENARALYKDDHSAPEGQ